MLLFLLLLLLWLLLLRMNCVHNLFLSFRQKAFRFAMPPMSAFAREGQPLLSSLLFTLAYALGQISQSIFGALCGARFQFLLLMLRWRKSLLRHRSFFCVLLRFRGLRSAIVWRSFFFGNSLSRKTHVRFTDKTVPRRSGNGFPGGTHPVRGLPSRHRPSLSTFSRNHSPDEKCPPRRCSKLFLGFFFFSFALFATHCV